MKCASGQCAQNRQRAAMADEGHRTLTHTRTTGQNTKTCNFALPKINLVNGLTHSLALHHFYLSIFRACAI